MIFSILWIFHFSLSTFAFPPFDELETEKTPSPEIIKVYNHVVISREESYPGNILCHDGEFLYFKSKNFCQTSSVGPCDSLKITPLAEIEDIYLSKDKTKKLTRFYSLQLSYQLELFEKSLEEGWDYSLKGSVDQEVPTCSGKKVEDTLITYFERDISNFREKALLEAIYDSGFKVINSPKGIIENLTYINSHSPNLNWNKIDDSLKKNISSPQCHSIVDNNIIQLLSGELSGNGINGELLFRIQSLSESLELDSSGNMNERKMKCNEGIWI